VLRLVTIPISHYCEKARWALDRARIPYREEHHVQGIHRVAARRAGGGATVPVLVTPDGAIGESQKILEWVDARLAPEQRLFPQDAAQRAEVDALCRRLDERLGPAARRLIYVHMFDQRKLVLAFNNQGVPWWEDRTLRYGWQPLRRFIERELGIVPGIQVRDEAIVFEEFDHVAGLLADGRSFLGGERFGAADLTFAALSAAATLPDGYGVTLPKPEMLAPATAALVQRARSHPAGRHALSLYAEQRRGATAAQGTGTVAA
jgi:glutathione S-transferase